MKRNLLVKDSMRLTVTATDEACVERLLRNPSSPRTNLHP
jgi:hypothetical protein